MPIFSYTGRAMRGPIAGEIEAVDRSAAVGELRRRSILVIRIRETPGATGRLAGRGGRVKRRELAIFTRQLSTMIEAGLPLVPCLNALAEQSESQALRTVTARVARGVETGSTLADGGAFPGPSTTSSRTWWRWERRAASST